MRKLNSRALMVTAIVTAMLAAVVAVAYAAPAIPKGATPPPGFMVGSNCTDCHTYIATAPAKKTCTLTVPKMAATVTHGKAFSVSGTLKPAAKAGTKTVQLQVFRLQSGKWVKKLTVKAKNYAAKSGSTFKASITLKLKGTWRVRAYRPADAKYKAAYSKYKGFKVK